LVETRGRLLHGIQRQFEQGLVSLPDRQLAQAQLAQAEATAAGARTAVRLAENDLRTHLGDSFTIAFSIPLSLASERANYRLAKQFRSQAELRLKQKEELVLREISDAFHTVQTSRERAQAAARGVDYTRAAVEAEERRLAGGKSSLFLVLELQDQLVNLQAAAIRAAADYNRALSQLNLADGSILEKNTVMIESGP
jgi:outer membrane protein TolC